MVPPRETYLIVSPNKTRKLGYVSLHEVDLQTKHHI
jgi:hypothetical protein